MHSNEFFTNLLRLTYPFKVVDVVLQRNGKEIEQIDVFLSVDLNYMPRKNGATCIGRQGFDERTWQHLSIFNFPCYLHCSLPRFRFRSTTNGKVHTKTMRTPWSKTKSEITRDLEDWTMQLIEIHGNVASVSRQLGLGGK